MSRRHRRRVSRDVRSRRQAPEHCPARDRIGGPAGRDAVDEQVGHVRVIADLAGRLLIPALAQHHLDGVSGQETPAVGAVAEVTLKPDAPRVGRLAFHTGHGVVTCGYNLLESSRKSGVDAVNIQLQIPLRSVCYVTTYITTLAVT